MATHKAVKRGAYSVYEDIFVVSKVMGCRRRSRGTNMRLYRCYGKRMDGVMVRIIRAEGDRSLLNVVADGISLCGYVLNGYAKGELSA